MSGSNLARAAVYYVPELTDPLWRAGTTWLGRDPETGATLDRPSSLEEPDLTREPAAYGFHATLKPPFRLSTVSTWGALQEAVAALAAGIAPFALPTLAVADLAGFLALRETSPSPALQALADLTVAALDPFRAPPDAAELQKRRGAGLPKAEEAMLLRWGYPHVFGTWRFHMTLTRRLNAEEHARIEPLAEAHFAAVLAQPRHVESLALFTQSAPGKPFLLAERLPLLG
jgi:putative phosphonate metabolism protein